MARTTSWTLSALAAAALGGCGLHVPEIQENPFASESDRAAFIQSIVRNVRCEVQDAVVRLYADNADIDPENRNLRWFDDWAAQISLTLTTGEKTSLNPGINLLPPSPPSSVFNLNLTATGSAEAQRVDKIGSFFTVAELKRYGACRAEDRNRGPFMLQSDLKLFDWLQATMISINLRDAPAPANAGGPFKSNVLSHQVKFVVVSAGTANPGWILATSTINVNQAVPFLTASRDRTQDLTITFGPLDPAWKEYVIDPRTNRVAKDPRTGRPLMRDAALAPAAASAAVSADIGNAVTNGIRNGLRP